MGLSVYDSMGEIVDSVAFFVLNRRSQAFHSGRGFHCSLVYMYPATCSKLGEAEPIFLRF